MPTKKSNPEPPEQASTEPTAAKVGSPDVDATKNEDGTSTKPQKTPQELWDSLVFEGFAGPNFERTVLRQSDAWGFLIALAGDLHRHNVDLRRQLRAGTEA